RRHGPRAPRAGRRRQVDADARPPRRRSAAGARTRRAGGCAWEETSRRDGAADRDGARGTARVEDEGGRDVSEDPAVKVVEDVDQHPAPLDPNFAGAGRALTDDAGRYEFVTIKPGAYSWKNHPNAWRPAHIHFSVFGRAFSARLVTQMYFPGDPLQEYDPIFQ